MKLGGGLYMRKAGSAFSLAITLVIAVVLIQAGCGHPTTLTGLSITPTTVTVIGRGVGATAQLTAYGSFAHPSETRDITTRVTWTSAIPEVATVQNGLVTSGPACGVTTITATAGRDVLGSGSSQGIMTATATFTVADPNDQFCPQP
jgi:Bacterial Ig-like domain (group 2)